jgi:hypothetical protein
MATLTDAANFATDPNIRLPLTAGMVAAAVQIMAEDGATAGHTARVALASQVVRSANAYIDSFAWAVATNPTVVDEWTTGNRTGAINDFAYAIASVWNAIAGISAPAA